jgi:hypothetical protein
MRRAELLELGLRKFDIERLVRRGHLQYAHGRYIDGAIDRSRAVMACAQAAHPRSVISHFSAAELTGLRFWSGATGKPRQAGPVPARAPATTVWLTCEPSSRRNLKRPDVVLRQAGLVEADLELHNGLWLTSAARTTVDIARELSLPEAVVTADHALARGVSRAELDAVLGRQSRWPGIANAQAAIAFADPLAESPLESFARATLVAGGLPGPILQAQFWDGYRWLTDRVDLWWPEYRTIGEADGLEKYEAATARERRRLLRRAFGRDQRLADRGLELVHFGWEDVVFEPDRLLRRFEAAFERGSRRTGPVPTWRTAAAALDRPCA